MLKLFTEAEAPTVTVVVEGQPVHAQADESAASVLVRVFGSDYRTHGIGNEPRAPFCMMGVCFECLAQVDGVPNRQACLVPVKQDMQIARQRGRLEVN